MSGKSTKPAVPSAVSMPTKSALLYVDNQCLFTLSSGRILLYRRPKSGVNWQLQAVYHPLKERVDVMELKRKRTGEELEIDHPLNGFFWTLTPFFDGENLNVENVPVGFRLSSLWAAEEDPVRITPLEIYYRLASKEVSPD